MNQPQPSETIYVDYTASPYPYLNGLASVPGLGAVIGRLIEDSVFRRHPRNGEYMCELVRSVHGEAYTARVQPVARASDLDAGKLHAARAVVLLWRDGNGTGWLPIERQVFRSKGPDTRVLVLNGRRRQFELTPAMRRAFLLRRFMGKSLAVEAAFFLWFIAATPFLFAWDQMRGHR